MNCRNCDRTLRPIRTTIEDHPDTALHQGRGLCWTCYHRPGVRDQWDVTKRPGPDLLAEVDALGQVSEHEAAARLGVTIGAIARAGYRHGRLDIARRFNAVARRERTAS